MLVRHPEKMPFVISLELSARFHPQKPGIVALVDSYNVTPQDQSTGLVGHLLHPFERTHVHVLGQLWRTH